MKCSLPAQYSKFAKSGSSGILKTRYLKVRELIVNYLLILDVSTVYKRPGNVQMQLKLNSKLKRTLPSKKTLGCAINDKLIHLKLKVKDLLQSALTRNKTLF